jgi:hypothetical protein
MILPNRAVSAALSFAGIVGKLKRNARYVVILKWMIFLRITAWPWQRRGSDRCLFGYSRALIIKKVLNLPPFCEPLFLMI